ncbi:MAG: coenzyme F420-0:L-glutamate ligase [Patescibacteria group bacterium]|nr:coenzyme F420-0:L-glutamate ligase [Patescibacteria group bacterium]
MQFIKVKTRKFLPPKDNLEELFQKYLPKLREGDVLFITSKVLAINQGRCVKITEKTDKQALVKKEADEYLPRTRLTIKNNVFVSNAGIDASNGNGYLVFWPKQIQPALKKIWLSLRRKNRIKNLGLVLTDTHSTPLRFGTVGAAIGSYGLEPLLDYRGKGDVFKRPLKFTRVNLLDSISAMAVLLMGESGESTPLLVLRGADFVEFTAKPAYKKIVVPRKADKFLPLLKIFKPAK